MQEWKGKKEGREMELEEIDNRDKERQREER